MNRIAVARKVRLFTTLDWNILILTQRVFQFDVRSPHGMLHFCPPQRKQLGQATAPSRGNNASAFSPSMPRTAASSRPTCRKPATVAFIPGSGINGKSVPSRTLLGVTNCISAPNDMGFADPHVSEYRRLNTGMTPSGV